MCKKKYISWLFATDLKFRLSHYSDEASWCQIVTIVTLETEFSVCTSQAWNIIRLPILSTLQTDNIRDKKKKKKKKNAYSTICKTMTQ